MKALFIALLTLIAFSNPAHADDQFEIGIQPEQVYLKSRLLTGNLFLMSPGVVDIAINCGSGDILDSQRSILQVGDRDYKVLLDANSCNRELSQAATKIKSGQANTLIIHLSLNPQGDRLATIYADQK